MTCLKMIYERMSLNNSLHGYIVRYQVVQHHHADLNHIIRRRRLCEIHDRLDYTFSYSSLVIALGHHIETK